MAELNFRKMRVGFQGEPGAFSESAAVQLLGEEIQTVPRATFEATFRAIVEKAAEALQAVIDRKVIGKAVLVS